MSEKHDIIERGVQAEQLIKNKSYATVMNYLVDEANITWVTTKLEQKNYEKVHGIDIKQSLQYRHITVLDNCNATRAKAQETKANSKELN